MSNVEVQNLVDPERLLVVTYGDGPGEREVVAVSCRCVPAVDSTGHRAVALEVVHDPGNPSPQSAYYRPAPQLQRLFLDPRRVRRIRPYAV